MLFSVTFSGQYNAIILHRNPYLSLLKRSNYLWYGSLFLIIDAFGAVVNFCASIQSSSYRNVKILCLSYNFHSVHSNVMLYNDYSVFNIGNVSHRGDEKMVRSLSVVYFTVKVHFVQLKEGFSGGSVYFCQGYALWEWRILTGDELVGLSAWGAFLCVWGCGVCKTLFVICYVFVHGSYGWLICHYSAVFKAVVK